MLSADGAKWLAGLIAAQLLEGAWIVVSNGSGESAVATITDAKVGTADDGSAIVIAGATFGEADANFEWSKRSIKLKDGTVIDDDITDAGRKVEGAVWAYEVTIDVGS
jgi:hypothetical protein